MKANWRVAIVAVFLAGFFLIGLVGTSTAMTFIWPAYLLLGLAGVLSIGSLFKDLSFRLPTWTTISVLVLAAYMMMRAGESPVAYFAREDAALIVSGFLAYAGFLILCTSGQVRRIFVFSLAGLVVANLILALGQKFIDPGLWIIPGYERTHSEGVGGLFNQPDHFAGLLAVTAPLFLSFAAFSRFEGNARLFWLGLAIVCAGVVCLSGSVIGVLTLGTGMIAFAALFITVLWKRFKPQVRKKGVVVFGWSALLLAVGLFFASGSISKGLGHGLFSTNGEASLPLVWQAGWEQVAKSPMIGTGSRSSYIYGRAFRSENLASQVAEPEFTHNEFLQVLADYGIIGLLLMLAMVVLHARSGLTFVKAYADVKPPIGGLLPRSHHLALTLGAMSTLAGLCCLALFDFALHLPVFCLLGAILLAILAAPDPMSAALEKKTNTPLPGGSLLFATRAISFGCGIAMVAMGILFTRSEYHYEMARLAFETDSRGFTQFRHLQAARRLDPMNPFALSLSAHAQVASITPDMAIPARRQVLEKADEYFVEAYKLYPQDVFAAVGHSAVLDELGEKALARERLQDAQEWAPLYGNLMLAEAEHHLRHGEVIEAETAFEHALAAGAFRDQEAAIEGLKTISEWKLIAQQDGVDWRESPMGAPDADDARRDMRDARIDRRTLAGEVLAPKPEPEPKPKAVDKGGFDLPSKMPTSSIPEPPPATW